MTVHLNYQRRGTGKPLLLVHGLGSTWRTWEPVLDGLAGRREVFVPDLPGFGASPPLDTSVTFSAYADALIEFASDHGIAGAEADLVGSSVGARLVLELARRGIGGHVVALDPGGFWNRRQLTAFAASIKASIRLIRLLRPALPTLVRNPVSRTLLLAQLSARPLALPPDLVLRELQGWASAPAYDALLDALLRDPDQHGPATTHGRIMIGWGRRDLVVTPSQASRARLRFPGAQLHWFDRCGHFPMWDRPAETIRLILESTS